MVACPIARVVANERLPHFMLDQEVLYRWTPFRVDALLLGGFVALVRRGPWRGNLLLAARAGFLLLSLVWLFWVGLSAPGQYTSNGIRTYPHWHLTWGLTFIDLLSACVIVVALESGSLLFSIFNWWPLRWLGRISYGAYVFHDIPHFLILNTLMAFTGHRAVTAPIVMLTAALAFIFTLTVSALSFHYYERLFIRLKDCWTRPSPPSRA
jgi:peptidoglycan/LPS O-acetylase OafA/YrhL